MPILPKKKNLKKWPFLEQNHWSKTWKHVNFSTFWTCCFYSLQRRFLGLEYHTRHFPGLYCQKQKKVIKNSHSWSKTIGQLLGKNPYFSTFWTCCFYSRERRFFVLEYHKRHFPGLYCLKKRGKLAIFAPKPWVNPFKKMSIFWLLQLLVFIA